MDAYYALEPMQENYSVLCEGRYQGIRSFRPLCSALGSREAEFVFSNSVEHADAFSINPESSYTSNGSMNSQTVQMITLDSMNLSREADYFLKMDIEGSEMEALMGGCRFIKEKRPNLAVCLYHKTRDLIDIPKFVRSMVWDYEIHFVGGSHTIMIAK